MRSEVYQPGTHVKFSASEHPLVSPGGRYADAPCEMLGKRLSVKRELTWLFREHFGPTWETTREQASRIDFSAAVAYGLLGLSGNPGISAGEATMVSMVTTARKNVPLTGDPR